MLKIFINYLKLWSKYYYSDSTLLKINKFRLYYLYLPLLIWILIFWFCKWYIGFIINQSSQELLGSFWIISWFLLTTIWIILSNTWNIDDEKILIKVKTNLGLKDKNEAESEIKDMKKLFIHEICFQFFIIILINILVPIEKWFNNSILVLLLIILFTVSINLLIKLIKNFIRYCIAIEFT